MTVRYRRHPDLRLTALEGEGVVLHLGTRRYFSVSESGLTILEALEVPRTIEELVEVVCRRFDTTWDLAISEVRQFLERCRSAQVILVEDQP